MKSFNECWFKDCHHMALLPIMNEFLGTVDDLVLNQVYFYTKSDFCGLELKRIDFRNIYEILENKGIECDIVDNEDLILILTQYLKKNTYAIIGVDNFYESIRKDYYHKKHQAHSLLINDIKYDKKTAIVLEQPAFFSINYQLYNLPFKELTSSYLNFIARKKDSNFFSKELSDICKYKNEIPNISIFSKKQYKNNNTVDIEKYFIKNLLLYQENIMKGIEYIQVYKRKLGKLIENIIEYREKEKEIIINTMTQIILGKNEELVAMRRIISIDLEKKYIDNQKQIVNNWSIIRNKVSKMFYRKQYNKQYIVNINELLQEIYIREKNNYNIIFKLE